MNRRILLIGLPLLAAALFLPEIDFQRASAQSPTTLRIATVAPEGSSWMKVFKAWDASLRKATDGQVRLRFYAGGSQGDERDFVRKMRAGQMDGAAVTTTGLGIVVRSVLALTAPGLITEYAQMDRVRDALAPDLDREFEAEGYKLLGWGDVGKTRIFSTEKFAKPSDLKNLRPWAWKDDAIFTEVLNVIGATPVRLGLPEVYPALQTRMVDTVPGSAIAAVSLQWFTKLNYVTKQNSGILVGATMLKKSSFDGLSPAHQAALLQTSKKAHAALAKRIRRDDDEAYRTMLARGVREVDTDPHRKEWDRVATEARRRLTGRVFSAELISRVEAVLRSR
jgi:TRAP-type transport system periplasmic protein